MARARNIKPGFFKNADLVELPMEARLLFIGLWTLADRAGRLEDRPKQIKMELFPADSVDVDSCLNDLQCWGFIKRYEVDGRRLLRVINFNKHQNPHRDEKVSVLPAEDGSFDPPRSEHGDSTVQTPCADAAGSVPIRLNPDSGILTAESSTEKPRKRSEPALGVPFLVSEGVDPQHAADWLKVRKTKRAPLTETAWNGLIAEAQKAGLTAAEAVRECAARSWQSLKAEWLKTDAPRSTSPPPVTVTSNAAERTAAEQAKRLAPLTAEQQAAADAARREVMARHRPRTAA